MSASTLVLGLLLALFLDTGPGGGEFVLFGWVVAVLGAAGVALHFLLPGATRPGGKQPPR